MNTSLVMSYVFEFQSCYISNFIKKFFATIEIRVVASSVIYHYQWNVLKLYVRLHENLLLFEIFFQRFFFFVIRLVETKWKNSKTRQHIAIKTPKPKKYFSNDITSKIATITNNVQRSTVFRVFFSVFHFTTILCVCVCFVFG